MTTRSFERLRARRCAALLALIILPAACTLTAEDYSPKEVGSAGAGSDGSAGSPPAPTSADMPSSSDQNGPAPAENGEGLASPVALDPAAAAGGRDSRSAAAAGRDAGIAPGDDAGESQPSDPTPSDPTSSDPTPSDPTPVGSCPGVVFDASCYEFVAEPLPWDAAELQCIALGGHLASVESTEEDAFLGGWPARIGIADGSGSGLWLGGSDARQDGDFQWWDDRPLSFVSWAPAQPDDGQGVDCIEKRDDGTGRWYDVRCTDAKAYVCEWPL